MRTLRLAFTARFVVYTLSILLTAALLLATLAYPPASDVTIVPLALSAGLTVLGTHDLMQTRHAVLRNYPISAHLRFLLEEMRPEMRQYFFESEKDGTPFSRDKRAVVYQRAKMVLDKRPFGTQYDVYAEGFEWVRHSMMPRPLAAAPFRVRIGGPDCGRPYDASIFNISAMSFGALSPNAIRALNRGAKAGNFAHDTGEGGLSPYHRENGGDIIWEIGSGYFGARNPEGGFSPERFADTAALDQVKMVELKISQGAKPGHGGVLPAAKVSEEISRIRGVPTGQGCISPSSHSCFSTPTGMMEFIGEMRRLSGGKPTGFKLCVGHPWEFLAVCKAMLVTGIYPDFIVIDGKEGGPVRRRSNSSTISACRCGKDSTSFATPSSESMPGNASSWAPAARLFPLSISPAPWRSAPIGAMPHAGSCLRSAASSRKAAIPTPVRSASQPRIRLASAPSWSATNGCG